MSVLFPSQKANLVEEEDSEDYDQWILNIWYIYCYYFLVIYSINTR